MPMLTFLLERQGWTEIMIHYVMSSSVSGCVFTQGHEGRVTESWAHLCILPLQRTHTDCVHVCVHTHVQLFDPMDCSPPGSSVHAIFQARILEWVAISISKGSFRPRDWTWVSHIAGRLFTIWATPRGFPNHLTSITKDTFLACHRRKFPRILGALLQKWGQRQSMYLLLWITISQWFKK